MHITVTEFNGPDGTRSYRATDILTDRANRDTDGRAKDFDVRDLSTATGPSIAWAVGLLVLKNLGQLGITTEVVA